MALSFSDATSSVLKAVDLPDNVRKVVEQAFISEITAALDAFLIRCTRVALELCPADIDERVMDYIIMEVLNALWSDEAWREAVQRHSGAPVVGRCPLGKILQGARSLKSFGDPKMHGQYFSNFSNLSTHSSMMQDTIRTGAFKRAVESNKDDFRGKVVMDVGSGSGILAFFALQAGAAKVYCVEAGPLHETITELAEANGFANRVIVVHKLLQDIRVGEVERVDTIISEVLGHCLFAERGIETMIVARDRFLKPGGKMFPARATFMVAPYCDAAAHERRHREAKCFWVQEDWYGVNLSSQAQRALKETFNKPLHTQFHPDQLRSVPHVEVFDFMAITAEDLVDFSVRFNVEARKSSVIHGLATWWYAHLEGSECEVILSTSPWDDLTHWWQTKFSLGPDPLAVNAGDKIAGVLHFGKAHGNTYQCSLSMEANSVKREWGGMDLLNLDTGARNLAYSKRLARPGIAFSYPDWAATKAQPTLGEDQDDILPDPFLEAKLRAKQSEDASLSRGSGRGQVGSCIRLENKSYIKVVDEAACVEFSSPGASLSFVAPMDSSALMRPQGPRSSTTLIELQAGTPSRVCCWLETQAAMQHMRAAIAAAKPGVSLESLTSKQIIDQYKTITS